MASQLQRTDRSWTDRLPGAFAFVGVSLLVAWVLEIVDAAMNQRLDAYGIRPRSLEGLEGIAFAPFLHAGFSHLLSNSVVFVVVGVMAYAAVPLARFVALLVIVTLASGLGAWLLTAPNTVVIGASGVVFGLLGFLLLRGVAERSPGAITISLVVLLFYGSTLLGVLPGVPFVSWQAHLFGFLGGAFSAFWLREDRRGAYDAGGYRPSY